MALDSTISIPPAIALASAMADEGHFLEAISLLTEANRETRSPLIERTLVKLRHAGVDHTSRQPSPPPPDLPVVELETTTDGVPWVAAEQLSLAYLRQGLDRFGCLLVPGLLPVDQCQRLVEGIDRTFGAADAWQAQPGAERDDEAAAWFTPFKPAGSYSAAKLGGRGFTRNGGGVWTVDSPRMMFETIETFEDLGLGSLITEHLGERPLLSASKCNLRRMPTHVTGRWHQDGSFLGQGASTIDMWVSLSDCGRDAPGLEIVPHPFDYLIEGSPGLLSHDPDEISAKLEALGLESVSPEFHPGDVMFFDHLFLHRTAVSSEMTRDRYALETWFFASSGYGARIPLLY